ncbi:hypothetical protein LZ30DRAFT_142778 [Colletotrichum cereale]|nr:hypothetical protein LZ30DRAFT_142778 [Colletotrichum cereale]
MKSPITLHRTTMLARRPHVSVARCTAQNHHQVSHRPRPRQSVQQQTCNNGHTQKSLTLQNCIPLRHQPPIPSCQLAPASRTSVNTGTTSLVSRRGEHACPALQFA